MAVATDTREIAIMHSLIGRAVSKIGVASLNTALRTLIANHRGEDQQSLLQSIIDCSCAVFGASRTQVCNPESSRNTAEVRRAIVYIADSNGIPRKHTVMV